MRNIYKNVLKLIQLYVTIPISNATAKRSFSCFRRLKNFVTNRLTQEHLNHRMFLHAHKDGLDRLDLSVICQQFIVANDRRINYFGKSFVV